ncbi:hypothetical protein Tco_0180445 [Tanacetum coccineum]
MVFVGKFIGNVEDSVTHLVTDIQKLHIYKDKLAALLKQVKIDIPNAPQMNNNELGQREGKAPMIEEDIQATHKTKEQIRQEEAGLEEAIKLQAQLDEEDAIKAKLEANAELTKDVLGKDLPEQDFAKRMAEMVNQRKKHFAEERAKAKRNKPMTQSQLRIYMSNYLKNQGTWKLSQLKKLKFEEIKEEFDKLVQQIDTFVPINLEATKAKLKRYGEELQTKTSKKQRFDDKDVLAIEDKVIEVKEEEPVKRTGKRKKQKARKGINVDKSAQEDSETDKEESVEAMNPTPLTTKSDSVVNWKIFQQGQRSIYQIIRANGADTVYMSFGAMVKDFTREDLIELYRLVMQKYGTNRPEDAYDRVLWSDLKTMFDPPLNEDAILSLPLQQKMFTENCMVINAPLATPEETATGKENSNSLIADSLLKTIRSLDPFLEDYIELNDLNESFELRRNQGDILMPTIEKGEVIEEFRTRDDELDTEIDDYPRALINVPILVGTFSVVTDFAVLKDMDAFRNEGMGDVIVSEPFLREVRIKARQFNGMITIYNGDDEVNYQIVRSHPRFKCHTNEQCNKILPLLKVSKKDEKNGISHAYQKLKGFYKGLLNLGPDYIRNVKDGRMAHMRAR